jgi:hypothetical protein
MTGCTPEDGVSLAALRTVYLDLELSDLREDYSSWSGEALDTLAPASTESDPR